MSRPRADTRHWCRWKDGGYRKRSSRPTVLHTEFPNPTTRIPKLDLGSSPKKMTGLTRPSCFTGPQLSLGKRSKVNSPTTPSTSSSMRKANLRIHPPISQPPRWRRVLKLILRHSASRMTLRGYATRPHIKAILVRRRASASPQPAMCEPDRD